MSIQLTRQQAQVVDAARGNLLISAAAGSGKTSVMTARITSRVVSGDLDVRNILVMTFTNAAASNMREKIEKELVSIANEAEDPLVRKRVIEQISYLPLSHISTIHSFCLDVISNFGYDARTESGEIIIEPGYFVLDTARKKLLFLESIDEVFTEMYELLYKMTEDDDTAKMLMVPAERKRDSSAITPFSILSEDITLEQWLSDFDRMISSLGSPRNDEPVREMIEEFQSYLRSLPFYEDWIKDKLIEMKAAMISFETTRNARTLLGDFYTAIELAMPNLPLLKGLLPEAVFVKTKKTNEVYKAFFSELFQYMDELFSDYSAGKLTWDVCVKYAGRVPLGKFPSQSKNAEAVTEEFFVLLAPLQEVLYSFTGTCRTSVMDLFKTPARHLFARSMSELQEELQYMFPVVQRLYEVLLLVDDRYAHKKRVENAIDFSDYEHLALLLLSQPDAQKYYSELFTEIYIDEYQDNSKIQDTIVSCFSRDNCFVVGDVKQSIYRFRHARPELFMDRMSRYQSTDEGELLELNSNFRSRPGILELVNDIFSQILSEESGEIEYSDVQRLYPQREPDSGSKAAVPVELLLIDFTSVGKPPVDEAAGNVSQESSSQEFSSQDSASHDFASQDFADIGNASLESASIGAESDAGIKEGLEELADLAKTEKEAMLIVHKIRGIITAGKVPFGDFAVLTRTNREAALIRDRLIGSDIPAEGPSEESFLSSRELLLMENMMRLLDNFRQDIPLAAIMRASFPLSGFLAEEILSIYLFSREKDIRTEYFHEKVLYYRENGSDTILKNKVDAFCDWIDSLRSRSMYLRVSELIEQIYVETGYLEQVASIHDGSRRVQSLETFRDWANHFEKGRNNGLYRFVRYIEDIREKKQSPEDFEMAASERDVVHCMSIHKSKGLEFKFVFLTGIHSNLSGGKTKRHILLSEKLGIGIDYIRPDRSYWYPTHQKLALESEEQRAQLAEYMRVFYVAMTRAEERLFLIGCISRNKDTSLGRSSALLRYAHREQSEKLPAWLIYKAKSYLDFCLLGLARNGNLPMNQLLSDGEEFPPEQNVSPAVLEGRTKAVALSIMSEQEVLESYLTSLLPGEAADAAQNQVPDASSIPLSEEDKLLFEKQIAGVYPFEALTRVPSKMTVSEIKRLAADFEREEDSETGVFLLPGSVSGNRPVNLVPQSIEAKTQQKSRKLSPTERGTLLHSIFQYLDFTSLTFDAGHDRVQRAMEDLLKHKMIREEMAGELGAFYQSVEKFVGSDVCERLVGAEKQKGRGPFREIPFSITKPVGKTDVSLIQGMIDCWFIEEDGAVLIDYKSDVIPGTKADKARVLHERYAIQLDYYARAIEAASGLTVKERIIWLIPDGFSFLIEAPGKTK